MTKNYFLKKSIGMMALAVNLLFYSMQLNAQTSIVNQCSGTNLSTTISNAYGPMYSVATANATNRTAVIYPVSQLTAIAGAPLTSVYYYRGTATGTMAGTPNFKVYLKEVTQADWGASFTSWSDTIASATLVYDGNPAPIVGASAGWKAFPFIASFNYSGTRNLAVLTEYTNPTASAAIQWSYEFTGPCANTSNSNTTKYSNNTTGTLPNTLGSTEFRRPYIGFDVFLSCYPPTGVSVSNITTTSAQTSWTASTSTPAGGYEYYYSTSSVAPTAATTPSGSTAAGVTSASLAALTPGTPYYVWVRSVCSGSDKSPWTNTASFQTLFVPPANDSSGAAITLIVNADLNCGVIDTGTTNGASPSPEAAPSCSATGINDDVWYTFTATSSTHYLVYNGVTAGTMATALYTGTPGSLTQVAGACFSGLTQIFQGLTAGTTYYARVYTTVATATTTTNFTICVGTPPPPPANDDICGAITLNVSPNGFCSTALTGQSTQYATQSLPACIGTGADDDVWYKFIATDTSHTLTLSTSGSGSTDRAHQIFASSDNTCNGTLTSVRCSDPETSTTGGLIIGSTYFVRVHSYTATVTTFATYNICITSNSVRPSNDSSGAAIALTVNPDYNCGTTINGTTIAATPSPEAAPSCSPTGINDDVWYRFTATDTAHRFVYSNVTSGTIATALYTGTPGSLTQLAGACLSGATQNFTGLTAGTTYYARVYTTVATATTVASFNVCVGTAPPPPANDLPTSAITLAVDANCTAAPYNNFSATLSATEPRISCKGSQTAGATVWFKFVAPASGFVRVSTDVTGNGLTDTKAGIFSATNPADFSTYQIIACDDDNGSTIANASIVYASGLTPGQTYYIGIDHFNGTTNGTFCVQVHNVTSAMVAPTGACTTTQGGTYLAGYIGAISLVNTTGQLVANVRSNTALASDPTYAGALNVNTGAVRQDGTGKYYLDRNYRITNTLSGDYNVQFFFLNTELTALQAVSPATTLSNLNVTRVKGETACTPNFGASSANDSLLMQTASGSVANGISFVTVNTPGFSNFYIHAGTTPLPITLQYLKGLRAGNSNALNWKVNCTSVSITMEIERSSDSRTFKSITSMTASQARCSQPFDYVDASPLKGTNYYRLKMIDVDGSITYSPIVAIINGGSGAELVGIYPTIVRDEAFLSVVASRSTKMQINITDMSGRMIKTINQTVANGSTLISINTANLTSGVYNITGMLDGAKTKTLRFVKQ